MGWEERNVWSLEDVHIVPLSLERQQTLSHLPNPFLILLPCSQWLTDSLPCGDHLFLWISSTIHSVSCFCQLFYPPNQSTPRIIISKSLHNFPWDTHLHPSLHDFHMKGGQIKGRCSHLTEPFTPCPIILFSLLFPISLCIFFSPATWSRMYHW